MILVCQHCDERAKIPADKISGCGFPMVWQCPNCDCITHVSKRDGQITTRFDSFSAINARVNPTPLQTTTITFNGDACPDALFDDCINRMFGKPRVEIAVNDAGVTEQVGGLVDLLGAMKRRITDGMAESVQRLFGFTPRQPDTGPKWKWSSYFDEMMNPANTADGWLSIIRNATNQ